MTDVRAAAERLRPFQNNEQSPSLAASRFITDMWTLTRAYLAEHPSDDTQPIDEDWLRSVGFEADAYELSLSDDETGHSIGVTHCHSRWWEKWLVWLNGWDGCGQYVCEMRWRWNGSQETLRRDYVHLPESELRQMIGEPHG